ncbi:MAG: hypothetical protein SNH28_07510 [Rikenellaceae bacterium]
MKHELHITTFMMAIFFIIIALIVLIGAIVEGRGDLALMAILCGIVGWVAFRESITEVKRPKHKSVDEL